MAKFKFSDIAENITDKKMPEAGDEVMYIGLEHLDSGSLKVTRWGSDVPLKGQKLLMKKGDILFGRRNTYLRRAAIAPHDGIFSAHGMIFRPKTKVIDKDYFPFFIASDYFMDEAIRISVGSLSPTVNWKMLKELEFSLPSMEEQKKLAEILSAANEIKEAYKVLLSETDELVKSQFIEMFGDLFTNEKSWNIKEFSQLCTAIGDGLHGTPIYDDDGPYPFINGNNLRDNKIEITPKTRRVGQDMYDKYFIDLDETTVMLSINGTLGKTALYNGETVILGKSACYSKIGPLLDREFVLAVFLSDAFKQYMQDNCTGTTIKNFGLKALRNYPMIVPPIENQLEYVEFMRQSDKSKFEIQQAIESLNATIRALVHQNFE